MTDSAEAFTLVSPQTTRFMRAQCPPNPSPSTTPPGVSFPMGFLEFWLQGITGKPHVIEASHDLIKWWELLRTNAPSEPFRIQDSAVELQSRRFYRVLVTPDPR